MPRTPTPALPPDHRRRQIIDLFARQLATMPEAIDLPDRPQQNPSESSENRLELTAK